MDGASIRPCSVTPPPIVPVRGRALRLGLATHEEPSLSRRAPETPLPDVTVFSVEPGIYLEGETGVRIEDLVHVDVPARALRELTRFPKEPLVLPA
jgi:Xaa-Pro aminopeptidase